MDAEIHSGGLEYLSVAGIYIISLERVVLFWLSRFWPSVWVRVPRASGAPRLCVVAEIGPEFYPWSL
jgi:hypothetical protein